MKQILVAILCLIPMTAFAQEDWSKEYSQRACGRFESDAYNNAIAAVQNIAAQYQSQCNQQNGSFSWNYKKGFCNVSDSNSATCPSRCLVWGTVYCQMPIIAGRFVPTTEADNTPTPGATITGHVSITNLKNLTLQNLTATLAINPGGNLATVSPSMLAWDTISPGQTGLSTSPLSIKVSPDAPCGSQFGLETTVNTTKGDWKGTRLFQLGRFNGTPLLGESSTAQPIGGEGKTIQLPMNQTSSTPLAKPRKVQLTFAAAVQGQVYVRFTLVSPDEKFSSVVSEGYAQGSFTYDKDLTAAFSAAPAMGNWKLIAKAWGPGTIGTLNSYRLMVLPDSYSCEAL